jgi:tetratricopeptide (TPR) repeat protein
LSERRAHRSVAPLVALAMAIGCASPPRGAAPGPAAQPQLHATLIRLGNDALAAGDAKRARERFERALLAEPTSAAARAGLGRALLAAGLRDEARTVLTAAVAANPSDADAHLALAELATQRGDTAEARAELERVIALAGARVDAHARLADLTGTAPATPPSGPDEAIARGDAHPYDPRGRLAAGEALLARGDLARAAEHLESALVLADLDPASGRRAAALLSERVPEWRARRVVWVHAFADEVLLEDPAWRFQQRFAWLSVSQALEPLLGVRFVVVSLDSFRSAGAGLDLSPILEAGRIQHPEVSATDVVAFATGRPTPRAAGAWRQGEAELLGRFLAVRLARGEVASRVLAHEVIHLFGGVHVNPDVDSLMNPSGRSLVLDPWNAAIVRATRARDFGPGGIEANVLPHANLDEMITAYRAALGANVALRNAGVVEALEGAHGSARAAAPQARQAMQLDEHLGDVASLVAQLMMRDGQPAGAASLWETAARLYGPETMRGRRARQNAQAIARSVGR